MSGEPTAQSWRVDRMPSAGLWCSWRKPDAMGKIENSSRLLMRLTQYHCPAVQLREDILGQGQGLQRAWEEVAGSRDEGRGRHPLEDVGTG